MSRFTDDVKARINVFVAQLKVPEFSIEKLERETIALENLQDKSNKDLEEQLSFFGGYKSYLEAQLGEVESEKGAIEASYEAALSQSMYFTEKEYVAASVKKTNKDFLRGEALDGNEELNALRKHLIEKEALATRIKGLRDAYVSQYATVSRVIAIRAASSDQV